MKIFVCKHGVEVGIIVESSVDYENEEVVARARQMQCQLCTNEMLTDFLRWSSMRRRENNETENI